MVELFLVAVMQGIVPPPVDSVYSTTRVRQLVERASVSNRRVPESLSRYDARVESEMAFIARQPDGIEQTFTVEQAATMVHWERSGQFEQRVVGYRSQSVGVTISAVGMFQQAWVVPILYGNRMTLLFGQQGSTRRKTPGQRRRANAVVAVHPFAEDRDRLYRFSGGDTVVTIRPDGREIPIVRVHVEPHGDRLTREATTFRGDIELDEQRAQIVRMRGYFETVGPRPEDDPGCSPRRWRRSRTWSSRTENSRAATGFPRISASRRRLPSRSLAISEPSFASSLDSGT